MPQKSMHADWLQAGSAITDSTGRVENQSFVRQPYKSASEAVLFVAVSNVGLVKDCGAVMEDFFLSLETVAPGCFMNILKGGLLPKNGMVWQLTNEMKPVDLYCYLHAKFGSPNGLMSLVKIDSSDNLIHWDWNFVTEYGLISVMGLNFRTEIVFNGDFKDKGLTKDMFIGQVKGDMAKYGKKITDFRKGIETWTQFINPYHRIKRAVDQNFIQLDLLDVDPERDRLKHPKNSADSKELEESWRLTGAKYSAAVGLVFGLRAMLPVLAESFVNLIFFILARPEIKSNSRLFNSLIRQNIDIRIQTLHLHCLGFKAAVDYSSEECKAFNSLMNERNDLLHGNVEVNKLAIGDVYFHGNTPLFKQYDDFWSITIGVSMDSVRFADIHQDYSSVERFIEYVMFCLDADTAEHIRLIVEQSLMGINSKTGKLGFLLPENIADFTVVTDPPSYPKSSFDSASTEAGSS
ncbi:hypothetical protein [Pseudomonas viridiflava]|uniref:hypothetical protein n=1 Tax=Pseudomonas viridiflava TaxID=33069 RepID=UPI001C2D0591|nr:hypothetical protein [Pseudomonas viridiflava]MBV1806420.1 hypothetical protein [Pseudomonas viridiflava]